MHPGQKLKPGARVVFDDAVVTLRGEVLERRFFGQRTVRLWTDGGVDVQTAVERLGHTPLPPHQTWRSSGGPRAISDRVRPRPWFRRRTDAGLHFTEAILSTPAGAAWRLRRSRCTLATAPSNRACADKVDDHVVDAEAFTVDANVAGALTAALHDRRRVVAVGTTTRALESLNVEDGAVGAGRRPDRSVHQARSRVPDGQRHDHELSPAAFIAC